MAGKRVRDRSCRFKTRMRVLNYYEILRVKRWYVGHFPRNTYAQGNQVNVPVPNQHLP